MDTQRESRNLWNFFRCIRRKGKNLLLELLRTWAKNGILHWRLGPPPIGIRRHALWRFDLWRQWVCFRPKFNIICNLPSKNRDLFNYLNVILRLPGLWDPKKLLAEVHTHYFSCLLNTLLKNGAGSFIMTTVYALSIWPITIELFCFFLIISSCFRRTVFWFRF